MCGICGRIQYGSLDDLGAKIEGMCQSIAHRGPDDQGTWIGQSGDAFVALGNRRLSILDLSPSGHQPMLDPEGDVALAFNGEVYNYLELREPLKAAGYQFRSTSDTEVILHAYKHWGISCVERFNGMFAIAILDRKQRQLVLLRDRLGKKPLYYYARPGLFLFGSELKALMTCRDFPREVDPEALAIYFTLGRIPSPYSIFKDTHKLPPGCSLVYDIASGGHQVKPYWVPTLNVDHAPQDERKALEELEGLLESAVQLRLRSDVPVGCIMSSGVDSCTVAAIANRSAPGIETFTVGFGDPTDEVADAEKISRILGTRHHTYYVNRDDLLPAIQRLPEIFDEPLAFPAAVPTYLIFKVAHQFAKVVLVGDGGDELFWGYEPGTYANLRASLRLRPVAPLLAATVGLAGKYVTASDAVARRLPLAWLNRLRRAHFVFASPSVAELYFSLIRLVPRERLTEMLLPQVPDPKELVGLGRFVQPFQERPLDAACLFDIYFNLADYNLDRVDRASMANSVEARAPLLDYRLVEYALRVPTEMKRHDGMPKYLLKQALGRYLPRELWDRRKRGFDTPAHQWLRGPLKEQAYDLVASGNGFLDQGFLRRTFRRHIEGNIDESNVVWPAFVFLQWCDRWLRPGGNGRP
ncbi:MAG: asparagine synthase (glutamine-hydrolyzing) [Chloroflexi bacterium]|nr:asparagine synthase (glutamine-hydrolyzing) [Chloroflexota bacterium]